MNTQDIYTKESLTKRVKFNLIRYANCWEDADVLLKGLDVKKGGRILSIGSAGDNSFSLLTTDPEMVMAIDISEVQLFLIELKKVAFLYLEYEEVLAFLGFRKSEKRLSLFHKIKSKLSPSARRYWEEHRKQIKKGIIFQGKFEKYFKFFRTKVLPFIHTKKTVNRLLEDKTEEEQQQFYEDKWNNLQWKGLFKLFFSRKVMGKYGRDKAFMNEVEGSVSTFILEKTIEHLKSEKSQDNYFLHFILKGNFGEGLPHYLRPENFSIIRERLDRLKLFKGYAQDAFDTGIDFNYLNLSNIFEYMDDPSFEAVAQNIAQNTQKGTKIAYWNLMVSRFLAKTFDHDFEANTPLSKELAAIDKGFFYQNFLVDTRQ